MRKIWIIVFLIIYYSSSIGQSNKLFSEILHEYVYDGLVDYQSLKGNKKLEHYLEQLSETNPNNFSRNEKLAFWINAYNAFTLRIVLENYPIESITDLHTGGKIIAYLLGKTVWDKEFIRINKKEYSLNYIEHEILRKMDEPRIHFAIVCASISCPALRNEAYDADKIEYQLENQAKLFVNDSTKNSFDLKKREAYISEIFNWFSEDFGDSDNNILKFISDYLPANIKNDILIKTNDWEINYKNYNWNLNKYK